MSKKFNIGDTFTVPNDGYEPFYWNFVDKNNTVVVSVVSVVDAVKQMQSDGWSALQLSKEVDTENNKWNNTVHGSLVAVSTSDGYVQWLPSAILNNGTHTQGE